MSELPQGFVLDNAQGEPASGSLPDGFVLDGGQPAAPSAGPKQISDLPDITDPQSPLYAQRHGGSFVTGVIDSLAIPGEVYRGNIDLNTEEGKNKAVEAAMTANPAVPGGLIHFAPRGAVAPAVEAATAKGAGVAKAPTGAEVVEAGNQLGISVPFGVATDSRAVQAATQAARQFPIGGSMIEKSADNFLGSVRSAVDDTAVMAAGGNAANRASAGGTLRGTVEKAVEKNRQAQAEPFKVLRGQIDPDATVSVTDDLAGTLNNVMKSRVAAGEGALPKDLAPLADLATNPNGATFNGLQRARTTLAERINFEESQGFNVGDLKAAYGAVTDAMENAVRQTAKGSPETAVARFRSANAEFGRRAETNKSLSNVLRSQSDEALADKVIGMASQGGRANISLLSVLYKELGKDAFGELGSAAIGRMGLGPSGEFSFANLVSNWNKLSPEGQVYLFPETAVRERLNSIIALAKRAKEVEGKFGNKSNTGRVGVSAALGSGAMIEPITALGSAIGSLAFAKLVTTPATNAVFKRWAKLAEAVTKNPSPGAKAAYDVASRNLISVSRRYGINVPGAAVAAIAGSPVPSPVGP